MYTGIVQGTARVLSVHPEPGHNRIVLAQESSLFDNVEIGASVSINGTCLTVVAYSADTATFDISHRTAEITTLKHLNINDRVNIERSHRTGDENGGHALYGHVESTAQVVSWQQLGETVTAQLQLDASTFAYLFKKGFIGLHGCSLTIDRLDEERHTVTVNLIPQTLALTNLCSLQVGDRVNVEIDQTTRTLVDTLQKTLARLLPGNLSQSS